MLFGTGTHFDNSDCGIMVSVNNYSGHDLFIANKLGMITFLPARREEGPGGTFGKIEITCSIRSVKAKGLKLVEPGFDETSKTIKAQLAAIDQRNQKAWDTLSFAYFDSVWDGTFNFIIDPPRPGQRYVNEPLGIIIAGETQIVDFIRRDGFWPRDALAQLEPSRLGDDPVVPVLGSEEVKVLSSKILVVDKSGRFTSMWTNVLGDVCEIPIIRESNLSDGVYIDTSITGSDAGRAFRISFDDNKYPEELKKYNIHFDAHSARFNQSSKAQVELETKIKTLSTELKKKTKELEELKRDKEFAAQEGKLLKTNKT